MRYNLVPSGNTDNSDISYIYVLPSSFEGSYDSIVYTQFKDTDSLAGKLSVQVFSGCSPDALTEIAEELKDRLQKKQIKYTDRLNTIFTMGIGIFILGIINWVIPDPLPFVDELFFTLGGGIMAWKTWSARRNKLPVLVGQIHRYAYNGGRPEVEKNNILNTIF
ncbi:MAG: hypothetical protein L3J12_08645, partial [Spirochaetales bacterium]|nr:hypothetical protein [Spirochaetales bacterium]